VLLLSGLLALAVILLEIGASVLPGVSAAAYEAATVHLQSNLQLAGSEHVRQYTGSFVKKRHAKDRKRAEKCFCLL
jgi:hypothetical protein